MHFCFLYPYYPPEKGSYGVGTFVWEITHALVAIPGISVSVVSKTKQSCDSTETIDGIKVYRISEQGLGVGRMINLFSMGVISTFLYSWRIVGLLKKIDKDRMIDLLEVCDFGGDAICFNSKLFSFPVVIHCHTPGFLLDKYNQRDEKSVSKTTSYFEKVVLHNAENLLFPTKGLYREIKKYVEIRGRIAFKPYLIDLTKIKRKKIFNKACLKIVAVGRVEKRKGSDLLCESFCKLLMLGNHAELFFIGEDSMLSSDGGYISFLKRKIIPETLKKHIHFIQDMKRDEVMEVMRTFDVLVLPSLFEGVGYVALEAMALGLPVIGSIYGGTSEIVINGETGYIVDPTKTDDLMQKLESFITNRDLLRKMGTKGRGVVENKFCTKKVSWQMIRYYKKIIKSHKQRNLSHDVN